VVERTGYKGKGGGRGKLENEKVGGLRDENSKGIVSYPPRIKDEGNTGNPKGVNRSVENQPISTQRNSIKKGGSKRPPGGRRNG